MLYEKSVNKHSKNKNFFCGMSGNFRDAQREMTKIRLEAKKHGVNIVQSKWETATVNY